MLNSVLLQNTMQIDTEHDLQTFAQQLAGNFATGFFTHQICLLRADFERLNLKDLNTKKFRTGYLSTSPKSQS